MGVAKHSEHKHHEHKALLRLYQGSIKALLRLYQGPIKALLRQDCYRYAQALVTDFHDDPWRPPWWLKRNQLYGDDETDRTTFQSRLYDDDYLDQPEDLKP